MRGRRRGRLACRFGSTHLKCLRLRGAFLVFCPTEVAHCVKFETGACLVAVGSGGFPPGFGCGWVMSDLLLAIGLWPTGF